jgi:hypothetical protein
MGEIMKNLLRKIFGLDQLEEAVVVARQKLEEAEKSKQEVEASLQKALKEEELAKLTPKERATAKGEPWVAVLDTHVNKDNIRNGFFELDWNAEFVLQLKQAGYGFDGDPDEEIVDRWFRDWARNILGEEGQDTTRGAGFINVIPISKGKSEVS